MRENEREKEIILNNLAFSSRAICLCTLKDVILMAFIDYLSNNALYKQIFLYILYKLRILKVPKRFE